MGTDNNHLDQEINEEGKTSSDTLENFTAAGFKILVEATKKSNNLPFGKARDLYESCPGFHSVMKEQADYVLQQLSGILKRKNNSSKSIHKRDDDDKFEMIVDSNDSLLENVGILLDELSGIQKNPGAAFVNKKSELVSGSWNENRKRKLGSMGATQVLNKILSQTKNIDKPQLKFKDKINNDSNMPFEPRITFKHNMLKPLACLFEVDEDGLSQFSHPYEFELEKFKPTSKQLMHQTPIPYKSLEETPLIVVNNPEDVPKMVEDLEKYSEIAVDLEHHSYRSFQGFTCLMQISTRDTDYIIDALSLRSDLELLNKVFTNPEIVKVFHGADLDILWLQRDLALYVINMFDTHKAAKLLNFPKLSLAYLLSHYCNINAQKQFQLADWRIRPLPQELMTYAREDTHYLLYIYDNLRNSLIEKGNNQTNMLNSVLLESNKICLKRYVKPIYEADGYLDLYRRSKKLFDNRQKFALNRLYEWRDTIARKLDESYAYVLPDHMMLNISEVLPREAQGILACCNPVPALVRQNLMTLHQIILKAREQPLIKPIMEEQRFYKYTSSINSADNPLQCPHDLNHEGEFRDDLSVLLSGSNDVNSEVKNSFDTTFPCSKPLITVFENSSRISEKAKQLLATNKAMHFTPYHLYQLSKKFSEFSEIKSLNTSEKKSSEKDDQIASLSATEKEPDKDAEEVIDKSCESTVNLVVNRDTEVNNKSSSRSTLKRSSTDNNRQTDHNTEPPKKPKQEVQNNDAVTSTTHEKRNLRDKLKKKKKKNKILPGLKEKEFHSFDFNSVDYKKYQSSTTASGKKVHKKLLPHKKRGRKSGKKNFGISI